MKKMWLIVFLVSASLTEAHANLKSLNCGTPRKSNGDPGTTNYSISVILSDSLPQKPKFYLVTESIYKLEKTITEPLETEGQDSGGWWVFAGHESQGAVRVDFGEASIWFSSGDKLSLLCR